VRPATQAHPQNVLQDNGGNSFRKCPDSDPGADDFENLISSEFLVQERKKRKKLYLPSKNNTVGLQIHS